MAGNAVGHASVLAKDEANMHLVRWQDDYLVGNTIIDDDHKMLFEMINDFYDAFVKSRKRSDLTRILIQLVNYAEEHFQREEKIMAEHGFPEAAEHHKIHEELVETIFALNKRLETDPSPLDRDGVGFLKHWLVDHILKHDMALGEFIRKSKAAAAPASS